MIPSLLEQRERQYYFEWLKWAQRRVRPVLLLEVAARWPRGVICPLKGGAFFREMSDRYGYPELVFSLLARRLGFWPWTAAQVVEAFAFVSEPIEPDEVDSEMAFIRSQTGGW